MSTTMKWPDAIDEHLCDQQQAGRINSGETARIIYLRILRLHAQDTPAGPLGASREDIKRTLARWEHPTPRARAHSILVSFYDWAMTEGYRPDNPARQAQTIAVSRYEFEELRSAIWGAVPEIGEELEGAEMAETAEELAFLASALQAAENDECIVDERTIQVIESELESRNSGLTQPGLAGDIAQSEGCVVVLDSLLKRLREAMRAGTPEGGDA
jgi:hypothetical protein